MPAVARSISRQRLTEATAAPPPIPGHRLLAIGTFVEKRRLRKENSQNTNNQKADYVIPHFNGIIEKKPVIEKKRTKLFASWLLVGHRQQKASIEGVVGS